MVTRMENKSHHKRIKNFSKKWIDDLNETRFNQFEHVVETTSTNSDLVLRAAHSVSGLVLVADHQTSGRGRLDRTWEALGGNNLLCSLLLKPEWDKSRNTLLTSALAVVLTQTLKTWEIPTLIKWPNDLVVATESEEKLAGILAEYVHGEFERVVIGFGLNIDWPGNKEEGPPGAISLKMLGMEIDRWLLLKEILINFEKQLQLLATAEGPSKLRKSHLACSATIGKKIKVNTQGKEVTGTATDITDEGLLVINNRKTETKIHSGDVTSVRGS